MTTVSSVPMPSSPMPTSAAGAVRRELHRRRPVAVVQMRIRAAVQQSADGRRAAIADGTMQGRNPALVDSVRIRADVDQEADHRGLRVGLPVRGARAAVGGVVKRLRTTPVLRVHIGSEVDQLSRQTELIAGGGNVECGICGVYVVADAVEEVASWPEPRSALLDA